MAVRLWSLGLIVALMIGSSQSASPQSARKSGQRQAWSINLLYMPADATSRATCGVRAIVKQNGVPQPGQQVNLYKVGTSGVFMGPVNTDPAGVAKFVMPRPNDKSFDLFAVGGGLQSAEVVSCAPFQTNR